MTHVHIKTWAASAAMAIVLTAAFVLGGCSSVCQGNNAAASQVRPLSPTGQPYARQADIAFEGGEAVIGLYDDEVSREFSERQPLTLSLQRLPDRIILPAAADAWFERTDGRTITPSIGDVVMNMDTREIAVYCQDGAPVNRGILLGHIVSGIEALSRKDGQFEIFAMKSKSV